MAVKLEHTTSEKLRVPITTSGDPTADPPEFAVTLAHVTSPAGWVEGEWDGNYTNGKAFALTPLIGADSGQLEILENQVYRLWVRWTVGSELPVRLVTTIRAS